MATALHRPGLPERGANWDYLTGTQINQKDGSARVPSKILSGSDAAESLQSVPTSARVSSAAEEIFRQEIEDLRCSCEARHKRTLASDFPYTPPALTSDGHCIGCGVTR